MDLSLRIARRLKTQTDEFGSTLFSMTWKEHITPAGRSVFRLAVSEPLTEDSVFIGWPTPQTSATTGGGQAKRSEGRANLNDFAMLAGWPTPAKNEFEQRDNDALMKRRDRCMETADNGNGFGLTLGNLAQLAGWKTPCVPNGGRISGNKTDIGKHQDGTKAQIGLENEAKLSGWTTPTSTERSGQGPTNESLALDAKLGAWPTPMAQTPARNGYNEAGNSDSSRKTVEMRQWPVDQSTDSGAVPIGYLLGPNGWEIVPASGQLNAAHSRWLMGLPKSWDQAGIAAFRSRKKEKRGSCDLGATETA